MMTAYLLITGDFVKTGGMDRANYALAEYLAKQGEEVHLVAYRVSPELLDYPNIIFHQIPKPANSYLLSSPLLDWWGRFYAHQITNKGGRVLVNGSNCAWGDVNWVHYVHAVYQPKSQIGLLNNWKVSLTHRLAQSQEQRILSLGRVIIANSHKTKEHLVENLQIAASKIAVIYYGIDSQTFCPSEIRQREIRRTELAWALDRPILIFIGALGDRRKGFDLLFSAWQELCADANWDVDLVVIGAGGELPLWQKKAQEVGLEKRISFLGFRRDVPDLLKAADCLVAPTRYEAYGLGVHEAICCGLPAIVSANAGVAERYPSELAGLLLPTLKSQDLISRLRHWREYLNYYNKLFQSLSLKLRQYTWDDMAREIVQVSWSRKS